MDDEREPSGIPITLTSMLALGAAVSLCCSVASVIAIVQGWNDPSWTAELRTVGFLCAGFFAVLAVTLVAVLVLRRAQRGYW